MAPLVDLGWDHGVLIWVFEGSSRKSNQRNSQNEKNDPGTVTGTEPKLQSIIADMCHGYIPLSNDVDRDFDEWSNERTRLVRLETRNCDA